MKFHLIQWVCYSAEGLCKLWEFSGMVVTRLGKEYRKMEGEVIKDGWLWKTVGMVNEHMKIGLKTPWGNEFPWLPYWLSAPWDGNSLDTVSILLRVYGLNHTKWLVFDYLGFIKKVKESEVAQSCLTLCDPMDCSLPGSSDHGILQARLLEWVVISFSRASSRPRDWTRVSCIAGRCLTSAPPNLIWSILSRDSQVSLLVKNPPASAGHIRDAGETPRSGRSPAGGHGNPLQCSRLENPLDRGA